MPKRGRLFRSGRWILRRSKAFFWFAAAFGLWIGALSLIASAHFPPLVALFDEKQIKLSALLGDTFGTVSALMATFAAVGAMLALSEQRVAVQRQMFVATFVGMMDRLQQTVQDTDYSIVQQIKREDGLVDENLVVSQSGQNAFFEIAQELRIFIISRRLSGMPDAAFEGLAIGLYESFYDDYKDALGHYFRQLYHILRYIDESGEDDKEKFAKLLRASCTNSQLLLLAYNAISGEGRIKFAQLIRTYSMLHNLDFEKDELGKLERRLITQRIGPEALESATQREDWEDLEFQMRDKANLESKQACYEYLLGRGHSTDIGISWLSGHIR